MLSGQKTGGQKSPHLYSSGNQEKRWDRLGAGMGSELKNPAFQLG
jgi:hypothetical protein